MVKTKIKVCKFVISSVTVLKIPGTNIGGTLFLNDAEAFDSDFALSDFLMQANLSVDD